MRFVYLALLLTFGYAEHGLSQVVKRDSLHVLLVGRHENADVYIDFPSTDTARRAWSAIRTPEPLSAAGPTYLRNLLPITIGKLLVSPGRYELRIVSNPAGADLVIVAASDGSAPASAPTEVGRAPFDVSTIPAPVRAVAVAVKTTRNGPDTSVIIDRSTSNRTIMETQTFPGSSSVLLLWIGSTMFTVAISAR